MQNKIITNYITIKAPLHEKLAKYKTTKDLALAAEIVEELHNYHILNNEDFNNLVTLAAYAQAYKEEKAKGGRHTAKNLTPAERSEKARKMALARWNKVESNKLIKDIK